MERWTAEDIPDQRETIHLITGGNSGLGWESALALVRNGAQVIMGSRSTSKGEEARQAILKIVPSASINVMALDLASLTSIRRFVDTFKAKYRQLNVLMNNAGLMAVPQSKTEDGFEMQFGVNHLGHFVLTGLLYDVLVNTPNSRVVTVSSGLHENGVMNFENLMLVNEYRGFKAYSQSKLANLLFAYELQRKFEREGVSSISVGTHPGFTATNLQKMGKARLNPVSWVLSRVMAQPAAIGVLPQLYAATAPDVVGGAYYGPGGFQKMRGHPELQKSAEASYDQAAAKRLWEASVKLTGIRYPERAAAKARV